MTKREEELVHHRQLDLLRIWDEKERILLTFFLDTRLLWTLQTFIFRSTERRCIYCNSRVGIALKRDDVVLASNFAPEFAWKCNKVRCKVSVRKVFESSRIFNCVKAPAPALRGGGEKFAASSSRKLGSFLQIQSMFESQKGWEASHGWVSWLLERDLSFSASFTASSAFSADLRKVFLLHSIAKLNLRLSSLQAESTKSTAGKWSF